MNVTRAKLLALALLLLPAGRAAADGWAGGMTVARLMVGLQDAKFSTVSQPSDTCSHWDLYFRFDASTPEGKNMYATLLAAKLSGKTVTIWYTPSTARGTNETNGCGTEAIAVVGSVAIE